ncbi:MAG: helix-hairpin-helix domain-containing protein [Gammaproteobacteria bacterium]
MKILKNIMLIAALLGSGVIYAAPVNINTATAVEIAESLNGIGEARAAAIVTYREKNGPFMSADQLLQVKGVGEKTLEKNLDNIMVKSAE